MDIDIWIPQAIEREAREALANADVERVQNRYPEVSAEHKAFTAAYYIALSEAARAA